MFFVETYPGAIEDGLEERAQADTFYGAIREALDLGEPCVITWGIDARVRTELAFGSYRTRVAYFASRDPERRDLEIDGNVERVRVLRLLEPAYVPIEFQPMQPPVEVEIDRRTWFNVFPRLAPEVERWPFAMARTRVRGAEYPAPIAAYVEGFRDSSYGNDATDSITFAIGDVGYTVWINPTSLLQWADDAPTEWYSMYRLRDTNDGERMSIQDMLDARELDWQADSIVETNDPAELLRVIAELKANENPAAMRARNLEIGSVRKRSVPRERTDFDERVRRIQEELALDDLEVNPSGRRARRNPSDDESEQARLAKEKFEEFHRHPPAKIFTGKTKMPTRVRELGPALFVLYASTKNDPDTGKPVKEAVRYIHEHDSAGVTTYTPVSSGGVEVPAFIRECEAVVLLGTCMGYAWTDEKTGKEREAKPRPRPELYTTPCGRALLVIQDRREVIAMVWGGALGVEARGIVG